MNADIARQLRSAATEGPDSLRLSLGELLKLHGDNSGPVLLMLMALLSTLPVAGAGTVLSMGIFALAWAWLRGRDSVHLPQRLGQLTLNETWTRRCLHGLAWAYERAERWLRPRWPALSHTRTRIGWAVWIALMGCVIFLPLPLGNVLPSTSLMLLSLGWLFRDGLALLLSAATGVAGVGYAISMGHLVVAAWQHMGHYIGF